MSDRDLPAGTSEGAAAERVLLNVNELAEGHDYAALGVCEPSPDGRRLAWSLDTAGDERFELRVRDLATGRDSDPIPGDTYFTCAWSADSSALFYTVPDGLNRPHQVWRLEADGSRSLVLDEPDARFEVTVEATRNGRIILIQAESRDTTEISWLPAAEPRAVPRVIWPRRAGIEYAVDHFAPPGPKGRGGEGELLVLTNDGASEFRVVRVPLATPEQSTAVEVLPGDPETRWESVDVIGGFAVVGGRRNAEPFLRVLDLTDGVGHDIKADGPAERVVLSRNADPTASSVRVCIESLVQPARWYDVELGTGVRRLVKELEVPAYDAQQYRTERFWAKAPDGELVPVSLARHEETPLDGTAPCLLWGYGAYESCDWPEFDPAVVSLLDRGVVYALAHIRGGGERGRRWWDDGHLATKHHTFSDFVAVADALADGLVDGARIVSRGLSAGGLLQGAAMGLAPHRWAAVIAEVPFVDCVNSMLDETVPLTVAEWDEWGDPHRAEDFAWMIAYSPYDNPPPGYRPPLLVTGSVNDPRVLVHEPAKWVARLRATAGPEATAPLLFRAELGAGAHVGPAGRYGHLQYEAEVLAFALDAMGIRD
jgi:oligopeptidase B